MLVWPALSLPGLKSGGNDVVVVYVDGNIYVDVKLSAVINDLPTPRFSLGGVVHGPNVDTRCGMMGEESMWLSPKHDPEVLFLKKIASARSSVRGHLVHGRLGLPPKRVGSSVPTFSAPGAAGPIRNPGPFPKLSVAIWIAPDGGSSVLLLATPTHDAVRADYDIDPMEYVQCTSAHNAYHLVEVVSHGLETTRLVGRYPIGLGKIPVRRVIPGRDVVVMQLSCVSDSDLQNLT